MRVLLDTCVWGGAKARLEGAGHDVVYAGDWSEDPGDEEILSRAFKEKRVLVTLDKDFGELAIVRGFSHGGVVRLVGFSATRQAEVCLHVLSRYEEELVRGALITAEPGKLRIRSIKDEQDEDL